MEAISTLDAPPPRGHYSQAIVHGGLIYTAGQLPIDPQNGVMQLGPIEDQTRQALLNTLAVIRAAGGSRDSVIKVTVFISDMALWGRVNEVYAEVFGDHKPARSVVPTRELHNDVLIEVEAVAALVT